jgi:hypothetical protein
MPLVLTTVTKITCAKKGTARGPGSANLRVDGRPVLTTSWADDAVITGCKSATKPCTKVTAVAKGPATKLRVGGEPVLLATLSGTTDGDDAALAPILNPGQTKLRAS